MVIEIIETKLISAEEYGAIKEENEKLKILRLEDANILTEQIEDLHEQTKQLREENEKLREELEYTRKEKRLVVDKLGKLKEENEKLKEEWKIKYDQYMTKHNQELSRALEENEKLKEKIAGFGFANIENSNLFYQLHKQKDELVEILERVSKEVTFRCEHHYDDILEQDILQLLQKVKK